MTKLESEPAVSIVMPFRDAETWIGETVASIQKQNLSNWELVAVDDHSSDRSSSILRESFDGDSRLNLVHNSGRGLVDALNHGLRIAGSEIVARMDADDVMLEDRLSLQLARLREDPDLGLIGSRVESFGDTQTRGWREYIRWQNGVVTEAQIDSDIYVESPFAHPSVMYRRRLIVDVGGYRDGGFPEDYELWLRLHQRGVRMAKLVETMLYWRDQPERASRLDPRYSRESFDRLRARFLSRDPRLEGRDLVIWGAGRVTRKRTRHLLELRGGLEAWIDIDPRKIGKQLKGVPVVSPDWLKGREPKPFVLVYIARHGAREDVTRQLESIGYEKGRDWLAVG